MLLLDYYYSQFKKKSYIIDYGNIPQFIDHIKTCIEQGVYDKAILVQYTESED